VLVEHGVHGSTAAAPIARKMFEYYFRDRLEDAKATKTRVGDSRTLRKRQRVAR